MSNQLMREPASRPGEATDASPGSARKIRVLTERAARRESLFHPNDNLRRRLPNAPPEPELHDPDADLDGRDLIDDEEDEVEVEMEIDLAG